MSLDSDRDTLETLAIQTYKELMANNAIAPEIRLSAAEKALRALGKDAPAKERGSSGPTIIAFPEAAAKALQGIQEAFSRNALPERTVTPDD